jgi:hypothetical protein
LCLGLSCRGFGCCCCVLSLCHDHRTVNGHY